MRVGQRHQQLPLETDDVHIAESLGELPQQAEALGACAAREEEIAGIAEQLFPPDDEARKRIHELLPEARGAYASVFEGRSLRDQWRIQAVAERTGAAAWRGWTDG